MADVYKILAAVNPKKYSSNSSDVIKTLKEQGFDAAVDIAKPKSLKDSQLVYNSSYETLEPVYFWILDFLTSRGGKAEKLIDNFASSPGSGHFSELMGKGTRMQEEGMKVMQTIGVLIKSVINIVYDLRQFELRLNDYIAANSKDKNISEAGLMSLKQSWLDNVDIKRGNTSIKALTFSQASFTTLLDAFFAVKTQEDIKNLGLNERVQRILEQRLLEFDKWKELSEKELQKRYNVEKAYLRSQVDSLKLYSRWAKPYLRAAEELRMNDDPDAALVKAFNTIVMQVVIFKSDKIDVESSVIDKILPRGFDKIKFKRNYNSCVIVDFKFRGIPQRMEQHYTFGGKVDVNFKAYALNDDELKLFKDKMARSDINDALKLVESAAGSSLKEIQDDLDYFLKDDNKKSEDSQKSDNTDLNPFAALFGFTKKAKSKPEKKSVSKGPVSEDIKPDNYSEKLLRHLAEVNAINSCFKVYDIYKKSHGMASAPFKEAETAFHKL